MLRVLAQRYGFQVSVLSHKFTAKQVKASDIEFYCVYGTDQWNVEK